MQIILLCLFLGGAGYSVGVVHAQLHAHEQSDGHEPVRKRVTELERAHVKIATVLELLQKRTQH
jgi:hypothetical protein